MATTEDVVVIEIQDHDIAVIEIQERGLAGGGFTDAEATQVRTDLDTMLARPAITSLDAVPNVNDTAKVNGSALVYNTGTDEVQTVAISGGPTGGSFTLTFDGQTTAAIAYNATAAAVQSALEALTNIGVGDVACTGGPLPGTAVTVTFQGALSKTNVANMTATSSLTGGTTPAVTVTETTAGAAGEWRAGDVSGAISEIRDVASNTTFHDISTLGATNGMHAASGGTGIAYIMPTFGGTGSLDKVARQDHTHNPPIIPDPQTFAATGSLSSGTRTLLTYNAGPLADGVTYDCTARVVVTVRNDVNSGIVLLGLRIGGHASYPKTTHEVRNVGGVDAQHEWVFRRTDANGGAIAGTGTTVTVTADIAYSSGDATNVRHGWVEFEALPRR